MLSQFVAYLTYPSGNKYRIGVEWRDDGSCRLKAFYWKDGVGWQCFEQWDPLNSKREFPSDEKIVEMAKDKVRAHKFESESPEKVSM